MNFNVNDIIGKKFGNLTVLKYSHKETKFFRGQKHGYLYYYICQCDCGNICIKLRKTLICGDTLHCGCKTSENIGNGNRKHGMFGTRIYNTWAHIKQRCTNPKNASYIYYGAKGIKVCDEWQEFEPFYKWSMEHGYNENLTIDRIDVNGNYEPSNCRWATIDQQNNNKSDTRLYTMDNKTQCIKKWSEEYNICYSSLQNRLSKGIDIKTAIQLTLRAKHK